VDVVLDVKITESDIKHLAMAYSEGGRTTEEMRWSLKVRYLSQPQKDSATLFKHMG
jgi:hypothetical protein